MRNATLAAVFACAAISSLAAHPGNLHETDEEPRVIAVVLAHPDDELVFAPAIHGLVRAGHTVKLLFATQGDQGPGVSQMEAGEALGRMRAAEAQCSGEALGVAETVTLDLGDGTLGVEARKAGSAAKRLAEELADLELGEAGTVITWGPDGGYGHSDHRMVSAVVTQALQAMPEDTRPKLLYPALIHSPLPDILAGQGWTTTAPDLANINYEYSKADLAAATAAAQCHRTQFDDATRAEIVPGFDALVWKGAVSFRRGF